MYKAKQEEKEGETENLGLRRRTNERRYRAATPSNPPPAYCTARDDACMHGGLLLSMDLLFNHFSIAVKPQREIAFNIDIAPFLG